MLCFIRRNLMKKYILTLAILFLLTSCNNYTAEFDADSSEQQKAETSLSYNNNSELSISNVENTDDDSNNSYIFDEEKIYNLSYLYNLKNTDYGKVSKLKVCIDFFNDKVEVLEKYTNLEELWIYSDSFSYDYQGKDEFEFLKNYSKLKSLTITAECAVFDMNYIQNSPQLFSLALNGFDKINNFKEIVLFSKMEAISLYGENNVGPIIDDLDCLSNLPQIKYLLLDNIRVSKNKGYTDLNWLNDILELEELHLFRFNDVCQITSMSNLNKLCILEMLRFNNLENYAFLYDLSNLKQFSYTKYYIEDSVISEFRKNNPNCEIQCVQS